MHLRVRGPRLCNPLVDRPGFVAGFEAQGIAVVVLARTRRAQVDDGIVARQFRVQARAELVPEVPGTGPVGDAVDRAAIAQDDRGIRRIRGDLQLALDVVDGPLGGAAQRVRLAARKASAEHDAGGFGHDQDVPAEGVADELERRGLSRARSAGQGDPHPWVMDSTGARDHDALLHSTRARSARALTPRSMRRSMAKPMGSASHGPYSTIVRKSLVAAQR